MLVLLNSIKVNKPQCLRLWIAGITLLVCLMLASVVGAAGQYSSQSDNGITSLYYMSYGESPFSMKYLFADTTVDSTTKIDWAFYFAKVHGQCVLIDVGFDNKELAAKWGVTIKETPVALLKKLNVTPDMIKTIIITHAHFDHIACLPEFPNAKVYISKEAADRYLAAPEDPKIAEVLKDSKRTVTFSNHIVVNGVFTVKTVGGHMPGSSVAEFSHGGKKYILTGDECYLCRNASEKRPIGALMGDKDRNVRFLDEVAAKKQIVLPCHDPSITRKYTFVDTNISMIFGSKPQHK
ncbi:MAG: MBL fold metallo-hydrolase [Armatimonadota bacterium]|nr:MBL fold metallo-hydrolase [bacterium]